MIRRSLLVALSIAAGYAGLTLRLAENTERIPPTPHQGNFLRAERFFYSKLPVENILVGSSLAERLTTKMLGPTIRQLAFGRDSSLTGLEIIVRSGKIPKRVLIEANFVKPKPDPELLEHLSSWPFGWLREQIPILRQENQPLTLIHTLLLGSGEGSEITSDPEHLRMGIRFVQAMLHNAPEPELLKSEIDQLDQRIKVLRERGSEIIFVEFPNHPEVANTPEIQLTLQQLKSRFPPTAWRWVTPSGTELDYETVDGLHLTSASARKFAQLLRTALGTGTNNPSR